MMTTLNNPPATATDVTIEPSADMLYIETGFKKAWQPAEKALREALYTVPTWSLAERTLITSLKAIDWTLIIVGAGAIHTAAFWLITLRASH
jgi:hypothetical protein